MKAYLAGPDVFRKDPEVHFAEVKAICAAHEVEGMSPLDNEATDPLAIFRANCAMIEGCDFVLANIQPFRGPSVDPGTAFEIGYAHALGKPVVMYTNTVDDYKRRAGYRADQYSEFPTLENFGLSENLMVALTGPVFPSLKAALYALPFLRLP